MINDAIHDFDGPVILLGGGDLNRPLFEQMTARDYPLVAVDGGANQLTPADPTPALIVGDLDSLEDRAAWEARTAVLEIPEQETTDFEKCLSATTAPFYLAFGFLGRRFDHSLAALHVLAKFSQRTSIILIDQHDVVIVPDGVFDAKLPVGTRLSVFPLTACLFQSSRGLAHPLDDLLLAPGLEISASNEVSERHVQIIPAMGDSYYAVILPSECLPDTVGDLASWGRSV